MSIKESVFLVVDDFEPMRKVTLGQLSSMGVKTILSVSNGTEALSVLQNRHVDIVLSDWNMPVMTGIDLLKAIRADEKLAHLPFVMITVEANRKRVEDAIAFGVSSLLVKPYTANNLAARIEKALISRPRPSLSAPEGSNEVVPPVSDIPSDNAEPATLAKVEQARPTILVVDDTPDNLQLLSELFKTDYRVRTAQSGEKALGICQSNDPPDLVLLDIMMPGMDGFEVAKLMREHPTSGNIPVIFITAMNGEDARLKGLELGAVDFVTKPIDPNVLKPRVRNFLRYVELHKQLQADYDGMLEAARLREDVENITRHDIKGPLAGIIGLVQGIADDVTMSRPKIEEQLRMVEEAALQVLNMTNLSSELFKIEAGRFKLDAKPVNIADILHRIIGIANRTFAAKKLAIDMDMPVNDAMPTSLGDAMFCYSLFQNLVKNACEAAPEKSQILITLTNEDPLCILIRNNGVVPSEIRERFFDKFVTHGKQDGTGLGTYSAKLLTEAQNGTISLGVSDRDNQTTLTVTLPRHADQTP